MAADHPMRESLMIDRLQAADAAAVLERFGGGDLVSRGSVNVISVEAIKARAGDRWERKAPDVWAYVERRLSEHLAHQDLHHRISDTDFLLAMTSEEGVAAQAVALKVLEEVLVYFLGKAERGHMAVRMVTDVRGSEISVAPLDPDLIIEARTRADAPDSPFRRGIDPAEERKRNPVSFVAAGGRPMRIDYALEHLISLKHGVTAALRIEPTVTDTATGRIIPTRAFAKLSDDDLAHIDRATVDYGGLFLPVMEEGRSQPALILPASFRTMGARRGRNTLIAVAGLNPDRVKGGVMVELVDVSRGTPSGRLVEVAGLLQSMCRGVFARVQPGKDCVAPLREARLMGITLDAADLPGGDSSIAAHILAFGQQARGMAPALAVHGLSSDGFFSVAGVAGLTHAAVRGVSLTAERAA